MSFKTLMRASAMAIAAASLAWPSIGFAANPTAAQNVTKACSAKYDAAKKANTLHGQTWQQFLHDCSSSMKGGAAVAPPKTYAPGTKSPSSFTLPATPDTQMWAINATAPLFSLAAETNTMGAQPMPRKMGFRQRVHECSAQWKTDQSAGKVPKTENWSQYWHDCNIRMKTGG